MKKWLICVMSLLLLLGFSGSVLAVDDCYCDVSQEYCMVDGDCPGGEFCVCAPGDNVVAGYDIDKANVEVYPNNPAGVEEYMNVCLGMEGGSSLPGMVIMEFDVDNNTATGGGVSMVGIFRPCAGGGLHDNKLKKQSGVDIVIMLMLRNQLDSSATAWCDECEGASGQCSMRGDECTSPACDQPPCYTTGTGCQPGALDCYEIGDECTDGVEVCMSGEDKCFKMDIPCDECVESCDIGRVIGEWYVTGSALGLGGGRPQDRGRIGMPLPRGTDTDDSDCYKLPWRRIVEATHADLVAAAVLDPTILPKVFDLDLAKEYDNLKWQISTWYQTDPNPCINPPCDDFFAEGNCAEVTDVMPNTDFNNLNSFDMADAQLTNGGLCHMFQSHFQECMGIMADDGNYKDVSADFGACQAHHGNAGACGADPLCSWAAPKCLACTPFSDTTFDGNVNAFDFGVLKYGWGRVQFPCAPEAP